MIVAIFVIGLYSSSSPLAVGLHVILCVNSLLRRSDVSCTARVFLSIIRALIRWTLEPRISV